MKTLDEKATEYSGKLCNQSENYTKGQIETAYVLGAVENKSLTDGELGTFGQAIASMKRGKLVTRKGWNGKGMFIFMRPADEIRVDIVVNNVKSLPYSVKEYFKQDMGDTPANNIQENDVVKFTAYLCMKAADGTIVNGWLASQTDILSEDWKIFN